MKFEGGPNKACAACKFQRRRCSSDCSLAPFFPADQPKIFHNVHRLFGVSKVIKILRKMRNHEQKTDAMKSIIYESNIREKFPVHGCFGIISQLHQELQQATEELHYVHAQLSMLKENSSPSSQIINSYDLLSENNDNGTAFCTEQSGDETKYMSDVTSDNKQLLEIQTQLSDSNAFSSLDPNQVGEACDQDYDIMNFYAIDDISSKEACESSSESSSRDTKQVQLVPENELKTAAAYFSLMNIN
ncbi:LOB domain-containing protein [Heracleum sosnowskyi]|uniref:LOB domain-containing protein n=1 Tax=Heracleum sosnowskyi TaxID=360622 RepID=A0AAD8GPX3_9APIA|nr:LOB domain-containing protein [Heracleum sosnowskyi]